jgi:nitrite reductase (NADH) large subunit
MRRLTFDDARCLVCRSCEIACALAHSQSQELEAALGETPVPRRRVRVRAKAGAETVEALRCEQCDEPLCVFACKSGALSRNLATGRAQLDEERCVGCAMCLMVCPFGMRLDPERDRAYRCDVCADREDPACVVACPTHALGVREDPRSQTESDFAGHVVVVGSSAAGIAACEAAREHAPHASITLVTRDTTAQYSRPLLAYALAGRVPRDRLDYRAADYLERELAVQILRGASAAALKPEQRTLVLGDGKEITYDALVIATGARGQRVKIPGADLRGVFMLRDLEDLDAIEALCRPGRPAVVVGGGNVGLQTCEALIERGMEVTVVYRSPYLLSQMVDPEAGRRVGTLFAEHKLSLRPGRDPAEILGPDRVTGVKLDDGEIIRADLVVVGKGIVPNVEWLAGSGVRVGRGVVVDTSGRTNLPGIYAAGDCAETRNPFGEGSSVSGIWPIAYEMGRAAGSAAVGKDHPSAGALRLNASRFFGRTIISIGEVREDRLAGARTEVLEASRDVYRKLVYQENRLVGALLYGDISRAGEYYRLYREAAEQSAQRE